MAKNAYIVNPGYSLVDSLKLYKEGNYPGAVLYGIHHFEENGYQLIFPQSSSTVLEVSKGASKWQVLKSQIKSEWKAAMDCRRAVKHGNVSLVYMPLMNFGSLLLIFRKLKLINRPVVACVHSQNSNKGLHHLYNRLRYKAADRLVFIAESTYQIFQKDYAEFTDKSSVIPLMPEKSFEGKILKLPEKYGYCMIGKTNRDFQTVVSASDILAGRDIKGCLVGMIGRRSSDYLRIDASRNYAYAASVYKNSRVNLVITNSSQGIYGLTSIMDSFTFEIPLIVTATEGLAVDPEKLRIGLTVPPMNPKALAAAIERLNADDSYYGECKRNLHTLKESYNTEIFGKKLTEVFDEVMK